MFSTSLELVSFNQQQRKTITVCYKQFLPITGWDVGIRRQLSACGIQACGGSTLCGSLSKGSQPVFTQVLKKITPNDYVNNRKRELNPESPVCQFEHRTPQPLVGPLPIKHNVREIRCLILYKNAILIFFLNVLQKIYV